MGAQKTWTAALSKLIATAVGDSVVVIVRPGCPHCAACTDALQAAAVPHTLVPVAAVRGGDATMTAMSAALGGYSTYPRVFVFGQFCGGNDAVAGAIAAFKRARSAA